MIDGGMNLDSGSNGSQVNNVGVDFVREVRVQSAAMSAEYGRNSGAAINAVTKSGTNQIHGGAEFHHPQRRAGCQRLLRADQARAPLQRFRREPRRTPIG